MIIRSYSVRQVAFVIFLLVNIVFLGQSLPIEVVNDSNKVDDVHPQDFGLEKGFNIYTKSKTSKMTILGSIRPNAVFDLNGLQESQYFNTYDIDVGENNIDPRFYMGASQTRFGFEMEHNLKNDLAFLRIEGDFAGGNNSNSFRLRHAYGTYRIFLIGQTWTNFTDLEAFPLTVDFEGPNSSVTTRPVQVRIKSVLKNSLDATVSFETPTPDITKPDSIETAFQIFPDIVGKIRRKTEKGHIQFSAIFRNISTKNADNKKKNYYGYGFQLSWNKQIGKSSKLLGQMLYGKSISSFYTSTSGRGLDLVYSPTNDNYEQIYSYGGFLSYGIDWSEHSFTYFTTGITGLLDYKEQKGSDFSYSPYFSLNYFKDLNQYFRIGLEYSYGARVNSNTTEGRANRLSAICYFEF